MGSIFENYLFTLCFFDGKASEDLCIRQCGRAERETVHNITLVAIQKRPSAKTYGHYIKSNMLAALCIVLIILKLALCCEDTRFILDYAHFYSKSEIVLVSHQDEIQDPIRQMSTAYISYESTGAESALEYIRHMQADIEVLVFIGSDHADLLQLLVNRTAIFHSKVMSVMESHPTVLFNLRLDTNVVFCKKEKNSLRLYESYAIKRGPTMTQDIGYWSAESGIQVDAPILWERRSNLMNTQLLDTILPYSIVTQFKHDEEGEIVEKTGIFQDIFGLLQSRLNFSAKAVSPVDGNWGNIMPDNVTWNGIIGELGDRRADISTGGLGINYERNSIVDYSITLIEYKNTLIQSVETSVQIHVWVYFTIFTIPAWIVILILMFSFAILIFINAHYESIPRKSGIAISCLYLIKLSNDNAIKFRRTPSKLGLATWAIGCYIVFSYYEADLTANMTSGPPASKIRSVPYCFYHN